jgi:hypothetical protein
VYAGRTRDGRVLRPRVGAGYTLRSNYRLVGDVNHLVRLR